jgi:hypothetical protein
MQEQAVKLSKRARVAAFVKEQQRKLSVLFGALVAAFFSVTNAAASMLEPEPALSIDLDTTSMFDGAQLIIDALGGPYLYIAGLALGAAILGAIIAAVSRIRIG